MGTNANSGRRGGALDKVFYCAQHACAVLALRQNDVVMAAHFLRQPRENDAAQRLQQQHAALGKPPPMISFSGSSMISTSARALPRPPSQCGIFRMRRRSARKPWKKTHPGQGWGYSASPLPCAQVRWQNSLSPGMRRRHSAYSLFRPHESGPRCEWPRLSSGCRRCRCLW